MPKLFFLSILQLSVQDQLGQLHGLHNGIALVDAHIAGGDLVNEHHLAVLGVAELELDVPEIQADGLEVVSNDLGDCDGLLLHGLEHLGGHNAQNG